MLAAALTRNAHTLLALALALGAIGVEGAVLEWLYRVETPVSSRTTADRHAAAQRALDTMLTRLTGLAEVPRTPAISAALGAPERYYQRYSFVADAGETRLAVSFAPEALRGLIAEARLPIWAADRPIALAWIVVEDAPAEPAATLADVAADASLGAAIPLGSRRPEDAVDTSPAVPATMPMPEPGAAAPLPAALADTAADHLHATGAVVLASASRHPVAAALGKRASQRGIEIMLPLMDLDDRDRIQPSTLLHGYDYTIRAASARYRPDYIILGRIRRDGTAGWSTDWRLWLEDAEQSFTLATPDPAASAIRAVDAAGDALAHRFAVTGAETSLVTLEVRGANSVAAYAGVLRHLEGLAFLDRVELVEAQTDAITLRVATRSSRARLGNLLTAGDAFEPGADTPNPSDAAAPMRLRWTASTARVQEARRTPRSPTRPLGDELEPLAAGSALQHRR